MQRDRDEIEARVRQFIDREILQGQGADLTASTPLFALSILDSFALFSVINFIASEFNVVLPLESIAAKDFETTTAIADTVLARQS